MGDRFKKVRPGKPLEIPAETYNAFLDAVRADKGRRHDIAGEAKPADYQTGIIKIKNRSGLDLDRYAVLALRDPIIKPADNLKEFKRTTNLEAFKAEDSAERPLRSQRAVVLFEPLRADKIGRGVVAGVVPVRVEVIREDDNYAELKAGQTDYLRSSPYGINRILWKEAGTGVKWAIVRLSDRPRFAIFELSGTWLPDSTGWFARMDNCKPVYFFESLPGTGAGVYRADTDDPTETVWHAVGYPGPQRDEVRSLHFNTGLFPAKLGCGDWAWCIWDEHASRWQVLAGYEDTWRFELAQDLLTGGQASAQLILASGGSWLPVPLWFTVHDALNLVHVKALAGTRGIARHYADSCLWEVLYLDQPLTVREQDLAPTITQVRTITVDQSTGLYLIKPVNGEALIGMDLRWLEVDGTPDVHWVRIVQVGQGLRLEDLGMGIVRLSGNLTVREQDETPTAVPVATITVDQSTGLYVEDLGQQEVRIGMDLYCLEADGDPAVHKVNQIQVDQNTGLVLLDLGAGAVRIKIDWTRALCTANDILYVTMEGKLCADPAAITRNLQLCTDNSILQIDSFGKLCASPSAITQSLELCTDNNYLYIDVQGKLCFNDDLLPAAAPHPLLSSSHTDTTAGAPARGDLITGQGTGTITWARLPLGASGTIPRSNGSDLAYTTATYPSTVAAKSWLIATAANAIGELASQARSAACTDNTGTPTLVQLGADQFLVGTAAAAPSAVDSTGTGKVVRDTAPTLQSYLVWTDTGAAPAAAGRLQRDGANLSWHNGTAAVQLVQLTGQLGGTGDDPDIRGLRETGGPTKLTLDAVPDKQYLRREGLTLIGDRPVPPGAIIMYGGAVVPAGWLECNGAAVSRTTYADLFAAIGTTWGAGDGSTTFNLPDLRSRFPIGAGQSSGLTNRVLGTTGGAEFHNLTAANHAPHTHGLNRNADAPTTGAGFRVIGGGSDVNTASQGSATNVTHMNPWAAVKFIIKT